MPLVNATIALNHRIVYLPMLNAHRPFQKHNFATTKTNEKPVRFALALFTFESNLSLRRLSSANFLFFVAKR